MDCISVKFSISDTEPNSSHVFIAKNSACCYPIEGILEGVFDFIEVLDSLCRFYEHVRSIVVWSETPDLISVVSFPLKFVNEKLGPFQSVHARANFTSLNGMSEFITER